VVCEQGTPTQHPAAGKTRQKRQPSTLHYQQQKYNAHKRHAKGGIQQTEPDEPIQHKERKRESGEQREIHDPIQPVSLFSIEALTS
jgi:hypothetical protein